MGNEELFEHACLVNDTYTELVEKISTEEKILLAEEESGAGLEPWEIAEITQHVLSKLPESMRNDDVDLLFDIIYDAINEAVDKVQEI